MRRCFRLTILGVAACLAADGCPVSVLSAALLWLSRVGKLSASQSAVCNSKHVYYSQLNCGFVALYSSDAPLAVDSRNRHFVLFIYSSVYSKILLKIQNKHKAGKFCLARLIVVIILKFCT
jgi:hypothetical protein